MGAVAVGAAVFNYPYRWMLRKSFSLTMFFQIICMQVGSLLYSLAQVANKLELVVAGRLLGGCGASVYPVYQFVAEEVGKNKRSEVISLISGFGKSLGFALGPISAATFAYVDFSIGEMDVDKDTNPGWIGKSHNPLDPSIAGRPRLSFFPKDRSLTHSLTRLLLAGS